MVNNDVCRVAHHINEPQVDKFGDSKPFHHLDNDRDKLGDIGLSFFLLKLLLLYGQIVCAVPQNAMEQISNLFKFNSCVNSLLFFRALQPILLDFVQQDRNEELLLL